MKEGPNKHTLSAIAVRDASVTLWYALVFCGVRPPYSTGGPEDWHRLDADRERVTEAIGILTLSEKLGCTFSVDWRKYMRLYRRAVDECILLNLPLVKQVAKKWYRKAEKRGLTKEDLVQEGVIGLMRAIEKFEPDRKLAFSTYAYYWIYTHITRPIEAFSMIRAPLDTSRMSDELKEKLAVARGVHSLNAEVVTTEGLSLQDCVKDTTTLNPEEVLCIRQDRRNLLEAMGPKAANLTTKEVDVLRQRFEDDMLLQEIGERTGRTRERIRQIEKSALDKLRSYLDIDEANLLDLEAI